VANDNKMKPKTKKNFPGGFFIFLFAAILIFMMISYTGSNKAKVSFSRQLEHLVNLDMLNSDENKMVAHSNNLVTFSGKFKQSLSEDSESRYRYLNLLNDQYRFKIEKKNLINEISILGENVKRASQYFLSISGFLVSDEGYIVVGSPYNTPEINNSIIIYKAPRLENPNFESLKANVKTISSNDEKGVETFGKDLFQLVQMFRSSALGIGSESIKIKLQKIESSVSQGLSSKLNSEKMLKTFSDELFELEKVVYQLNSYENSVRLFQTRSVRSYIEKLVSLQNITDRLNENSIQLEIARDKVSNFIWFFNNKEVSTTALEQQDPETYQQWFANAKEEWENFSTNQGLFFKAPDQPRNKVLENKFQTQEQSTNYFGHIITFLPVIILILLFYFLFSRQMKGAGSSAMNFGKSPARLLTKEMNTITFKDVAGAEEAKEELQEIVEFLKDPQKFTSLGARIPKGVLLVGPPGTGKTLVAKAVAGEADRPFYTISGSDFVEMFVGVGASRIRDLFDQAKKNAPCIIFMDEIDAVGRHRGAGIGGGHDEREQTLNQLLVEMDGFDTKEGVILMAATNRPDILDKALLRPGRFDRRVSLDLPDIKGRYEILKVHARKIKIDSSVDLMDIARSTPGASGADLQNILNESALIAARHGRKAVTSVETREACDKVRYGKERRSLEMDEAEKRTTAFHESGHAIVGLKVKNADPIDKVTIIPRGFSLGATHFMPKKNRVSYWRKEAIDQLAVLMGGRAAEEIFIGDFCSGAQHDISQATKLARAMVCEWGMSENIGLVSFDESSESGKYLGIQGYHEKKYSEETAKKIDIEINSLIEQGHKTALEIVKKHEKIVQLMADMLMEFETLDAKDINEMIADEWDIEKKRQRLKDQDELHRKLPPPPPKLDEQKEQGPENPSPDLLT
jgi:cell division protease FtsH